MNDKESSSSLVSRKEIPIIDLEGLSNSPSEQWFKEKAKQLNEALSGCGLALFINHGIPEERLQTAHRVMDTFYALPDNVKNRYKMNPSDSQQGYIAAGSEKLDDKAKLEMKYCYNILGLSGKLPTEEIPHFMEVIGGVAEDLLNVARLLLKLIAIALELDPELFLSFHNGMFKEDNLSTLRLILYPPVMEESVDNIIRCGAHTDWGTFTLLTQDSEGGLEVLIGGKWNHVGHFPGAILFNLGNMMEIWTSSRYRAIEHRVVVPNDTKLRNKCRHSLAFFVHPDNNTLLHPCFLTQCQPWKEVEKPTENIINAFDYANAKRADSYS